MKIWGIRTPSDDMGKKDERQEDGDCGGEAKRKRPHVEELSET